MDFILASASPRRSELLDLLNLEFAIEPAGIDEVIPDDMSDPAFIARELARQKAIVIATRHPGSAVLAADTMVAFQGELLGKPMTSDQARQMLSAMRNKTNRVVTGVAVIRDEFVRIEHVQTSVQMRDFSDMEIKNYIASGSPFDKAGGYAIQDETFRPVESIIGCNCNVIGLPLIIAIELLRKAGVSIPPTKLESLTPECSFCPLFNR